MQNSKAMEKFLKRVLTCYSLMVLLLITSHIGMYAVVYRMFEERATDANAQALYYTASGIDDALSTVNDITRTLNKLPVATQLAQRGVMNEETLLQLRNNTRSLPTLLDTSGMLGRYYVYGAFNDIILAPNQVFLQLGLYYKGIFHCANMDCAAWHKTILERRGNFAIPMNDVLLDGELRSALLIARELYAFNLPLYIGKVVFYLDLDEIQRLAAPVLQSGANFLCILDENNQPLISLGDTNDAQIDAVRAELSVNDGGSFKTSDNLLVHYEASASNGWTVISAIPISLLSAQTRSALAVYAYAFIALTLLFGLFVSQLYKTSTKPLIRIYRQLRAAEGSTAIDRAVDDLLTDRNRLLEIKDEQENALSNLCAAQLISGVRPDTLGANVRVRLNLPDSFDYCRGVYMKLTPPSAVSEARRESLCLMATALVRAYRDEIRMLLMESQNVFALLYLGSGEVCEQPALFATLYRAIHDNCGLDATFYLGAAVESLERAYISFDGAKQQINADALSSDRFLFVAPQSIPEDGLFAYTFRDEQRLMALLSAGDMNSLNELLHELRAANYEERVLPKYTAQLLQRRIVSTLLMLNAPLAVDDELLYANDALPPDQFFDAVGKYLNSLCALERARRNASRNALIDEVRAYVAENYTNPDLNLMYVALKFSVTESYLSSLFKETTGVNFSAFLENTRIDAVTRLLNEPLSIEKLAERAGYRNVDTFRRAFKRLKGVSPSQQRAQKSL